MSRHQSEAGYRRLRDWLRRAIVGVCIVLAVCVVPLALELRGRGALHLAREDVAAIKVAVGDYYLDHGEPPPDTGSWNEAAFDPRSLHRHLGRPFRDPHTGRSREAYLPMRPERLVDLDADGVGIFVDPWGNPYHLDAMHVTRKDGRYVRIDWPYLPSRPKEKRTLDYKIVSFGPDGKSDPVYPFDWNAEHPDAKDDIRCW